MLFNLKAEIVLKTEFKVEAETLVEARKIAEKRIVDSDFDSLEMDRVSWDMTDPSIREYNHEMCKKRLEEYKRVCATEP